MYYEADENELMNLVRSVNNRMNHVLNQLYRKLNEMVRLPSVFWPIVWV